MSCFKASLFVTASFERSLFHETEGHILSHVLAVLFIYWCMLVSCLERNIGNVYLSKCHAVIFGLDIKQLLNVRF